jgi:hypothetical protein
MYWGSIRGIGLFSKWNTRNSLVLRVGLAWSSSQGVGYRGFANHHWPPHLWPWASHFTSIASSFEWKIKPRFLVPDMPECLCQGEHTGDKRGAKILFCLIVCLPPSDLLCLYHYQFPWYHVDLNILGTPWELLMNGTSAIKKSTIKSCSSPLKGT